MSILYVALEGFYVGALEEQGAAQAGKPLAVHEQQRVIDANAAAFDAGVRIGMSRSEAKNMLIEGGRLVAFEEEPYRAAQIRLLDRLALFTDRIQPRLPHEAWADLSRHPDLAVVLQEITEKTFAGVPAQIGWGPSKWVAELRARQPTPRETVGWSLSVHETMAHTARWLADQPVEALLPLAPAILQRLRFLGYRRVGEVAELPQRVLKQQFGAEAWRIRDAAIGALREDVEGRYPPDRVLARQSLGRCADSEALLRTWKRLARQLERGLNARDAAGRMLVLSVALESGKTVREERTFSRPLADGRAVFSALVRLMPVVQEPIVEVVAELPNLEKRQRKQPNLEGQTPLRERTLAAESAFRAIRTVYGDSAIQVAAELPIPRRVRVMRAWTDATGWR